MKSKAVLRKRNPKGKIMRKKRDGVTVRLLAKTHCDTSKGKRTPPPPPMERDISLLNMGRSVVVMSPKAHLPEAIGYPVIAGAVLLKARHALQYHWLKIRSEGIGVRMHCHYLSGKVGLLFTRLGRLAGRECGYFLNDLSRSVYTDGHLRGRRIVCSRMEDYKNLLQRRALILVILAHRTASTDYGLSPANSRLIFNFTNAGNSATKKKPGTLRRNQNQNQI
ncbi:hypothetical protein V1478_009087 [Vespula squamosa]|uniref:Uncharacterized protein n=1 Tax=Vespula squamosa TaxID=30214 RepID=A0ABD2ANN0_VESSQ